MKLQILNRKVHYWLAFVVAVPVLIIIVTGLLLQVKKQASWVQPKEYRGGGTEPAIALSRVLEICQSIPEVGVQTWADITRVDLRPAKGMLKVSTKTHWEVQLDAQTAQVLQTAYRRSDIIEAIHDGSWFHPWAKLGVFLPSGLILLILWVTGIYLFLLPFLNRLRRAQKNGVVLPKSHEPAFNQTSSGSSAALVLTTAGAIPSQQQVRGKSQPVTRAFTLVELLVVIAIIGVLSALLLPALAQAQGKAKQVSCLSNARQLSLALMMYIDDHENTFPPSADYGLPISDPSRIWTVNVLSYVQNPNVFSCPTVPDRTFPSNWAERGFGSIGYTTATAYDITGVEGFPEPLRASTIESPSQTPLFADAPNGPTTEKYRGFTFDPDNGDANASDPRLGTPLISTEDLVKQLSHLVPAALKPVYARHAGMANVIHADGHARGYTVRSIQAQQTGLHWRFRSKLRPRHP